MIIHCGLRVPIVCLISISCVVLTPILLHIILLLLLDAVVNENCRWNIVHIHLGSVPRIGGGEG